MNLSVLPDHAPLRPRRDPRQTSKVSAEEVDEYLDALEEPKRITLSTLRETILEILPEAGGSWGFV